MKGSSMTTHMGNLTIDNEVIGQYAGTVAMECFGIVGMAAASMKGGLAVKLLKSDKPDSRALQCYDSMIMQLTLDFHVIVAYGVSILAVADNLIEQCKI